MELNIKEGYCYQVINRLVDVTTPKTANLLQKLSSSRGAIELNKVDALDRGFVDLANWSMPEYDNLYLVDEFILVCIPKNGDCYI